MHRGIANGTTLISASTGMGGVVCGFVHQRHGRQKQQHPRADTKSIERKAEYPEDTFSEKVQDHPDHEHRTPV